jgi:Ca2+-transporting ATPase
MNSIALAVAAIPEGLPAICTVVIALGIQRIIKSDITVKKIKALELLGKTTVICSDKTGVITKNHMYLEKIFNKEGFTEITDESLSEANALTLKLAAACSTLDNDATENSIENACLKHTNTSKDEIDNLYPRLKLIPFDSDRKTMTSINMISGQPIAIVKGAPEILASKFIDFKEENILKANDEMASDGLRIVCLGIKPLGEVPAIPTPEDIEKDLIFVGLLGLADPPKSETINALSACDTAGIRTIMITGDNLLTAKAIARRVGILKDGTEAITGAELATLTDEELLESIEKYSVYARITPDDKIRIITAWQNSGNTVTVTGDSISDADALAIANIGCAIGENGTDVAKGNADVIIKNNNFASIVDAIRESRGLFANIQKSVGYLLSCNIAEILLYIVGLIVFGAPPLLAVQLLWINLLTDTTPVISLSSQNADYSVMSKKPVTLSGKLFGLKKIIDLIIFAVLICFISIISAVIGNSMSFNTGMTETGMTMAFLTMSLAQVLHSFNMRSENSIFKIKLKLKDFMLLSSLVMLFIIFFLTLTPAGFVFGLTILNAAQFFIAIALALVVIPVSEIIKLKN